MITEIHHVNELFILSQIGILFVKCQSSMYALPFLMLKSNFHPQFAAQHGGQSIIPRVAHNTCVDLARIVIFVSVVYSRYMLVL